MATVHLEFERRDIARIVLMPGDPLRAKYIADNYLSDVVMINEVRNNLGYTGYYKGIKVSVIASGMGIPSMGIYAFELFKYYDVDYIIRLGTCGSLNKRCKIGGLILANEVFSESNFAKIYNNDQNDTMPSSRYLNRLITNTAKDKGIKITKGKIMTTDVFEPHIDGQTFHEPRPDDLMASEMESFALFFLAKFLNKQATTILTVSDSPFENKILSSQVRQNNLHTMIELALDAIIKVEL